MAAIQWIRFILGGIFLLAGLTIFVFELIGVFRFRYVLNRMHAAAMGDTLGIGFSFIGLILMEGLTFTSLKLLVVIFFLWFSSPVSSHLIARLEVTIDEESEEHYKRIDLREKNYEKDHSMEADYFMEIDNSMEADHFMESEKSMEEEGMR